MHLTLHRHGDSQGTAATSVEVHLAWPAPGKLALTYVVSGDIAALKLPAPAAGDTRLLPIYRESFP